MIKKSLIENKYWSKKSQKGITLMALIITIIVLLILSTVTLYNLTDKDSSMLESVETQREDMLKMEVKQTIEVTAEKIKLEHATNKNLTLQEFTDELEEKLKKNDSKSNIDVYFDENSDGMYKVNYNKYLFIYFYDIEINQNILTIKHYLENVNDTNYTLYTTTTDETLKNGQTITLADYKTTVANGTYDYGSLTESTSGGTTETTTTMSSNKTIALYYKRNTATVSLSKDENISNVTGAGTYKVGANVSVSAELSSATGYTISFKNWIGTSTSSSNPYTFTMPASNVTLTANSTKSANTYGITLDSQNSTTAGSTAIYEKYATGIYKDSDCTTQMSTSANQITIPTKTGYIFGGYYTETDGNGTQMINLSGYITSDLTPTTYSSSGILYAKWTKNDNTDGGENIKLGSGEYRYYNPVIPAGFKIVDTENAKWNIVYDSTIGDNVVEGWNDGLVIEDSQGNQFVWVPIDGTDVTYTIVSGGDTLPDGVTDESTQITTYEGFYIGRYEAGIPSDLTTALTTASAQERNVSGVPISMQNQIPWNYIDYDTSKSNAEAMYTTNNVKSGLVTGTQWNTVMQWLENAEINVETDSSSWGNYYDSTVTGITGYYNYIVGILSSERKWVSTDTKPANDTILLTTGNSDYTKRKNIYDLAGNVGEWINLIISPGRAIAGGSANYKGTAWPCKETLYWNLHDTSEMTGFRCVLYVT